MFNTIGTHNFGIEIQDSTVTVLPGTARIGNTITSFDGTSTFFQRITDFSDTTRQYQNTLLYLSNFNGTTADMTRSSSDVTSSRSALQLPSLPTDSSNPYSPAFPLTMMTFESSDSTISLLSYTKL